MSCDISLDEHKDAKIPGQSPDYVKSNNSGATSEPINTDAKESFLKRREHEIRVRAQEKEIMQLRQQIAMASLNEVRLLNEKYTLEKRFAELRMALDENQSNIIASASREIELRKGDIEVNLNLLNDLKAVEDEKHMFTASLLGILAEYGAYPHVANASALANNIKHLHDHLQLKIQNSHVKLTELTSKIGNNSLNAFPDKDIPGLSRPMSYKRVDDFSLNGHHINAEHFKPANNVSKYPEFTASNRSTSSMPNGEIHQLQDISRPLPEVDRNDTGHIADNMPDQIEFHPGSDPRSAYQFPHPLEERGPGINGFQIIGDAKPGGQLQGCGLPTHGTSLCMFQWVRHYPDGTRQYIEGATNPDYVVTADDVDKFIAVECIPMDEQGRQGDIVRTFANDNNKITCDDKMQEEIDSYISRGWATFNVSIVLFDSDTWEPGTLFLRRSAFQVTIEKKNDVVISEKYSKDLLIQLPIGLSTQFVLTCSNGSSYPFHTSDDIRLRDTLVLTMRIFQSKAIDDKGKRRVNEM